MPLLLASNQLNELKIYADLAGCNVVLYYRNPTPKEVMAYNNAVIQRKGNKVIFRYAEAQEVYGKKILKGFREGDFTVPGPDEKPVLISSDKDSEYYKEDWMALIWKYAPYMILTFASKIFGSPAETLDEMEDTLEPGDEEDKEDEDAEKD